MAAISPLRQSVLLAIRMNDDVSGIYFSALPNSRPVHRSYKKEGNKIMN